MNLWRANFEDMFIRFDVIHKRDRQTLHDSKDRAYASHRTVKIRRPRASKACELQQQ